MGNALFIVWRESAEAMLFLGIVPPLSGAGLDYFELGMMLVASALIVQMVFWMRRHGRTFKKHLEDSMAENARRANWWGLLVVVALAVGRETAEAVVFLYGLGAEKGGIAHLPVVLVLGIAAALATFWLLQQGTRFLSWRTFFRVSEVLLLLLAGALLVSGVEKLIALGIVPDVGDPLWNTVWLLDDSSRLGGLVASFTGYRARPALLPVAALAVYWASMIFFLYRPRRNVAAAPVTAPPVRHAPHS